jgi:hypothetical protein
VRTDLLALTDDALAALANRGIVKRAVREVASGKGPTLTDEDGTVTATFPDGTTVVLPPGATVEQSDCTCPATDLCRHRVMLAVAYRSLGDAEAAQWTPAAFTDDDLEALLGSRILAAARRTRRSGYRARVRRPTPADPVPTVELAACTVRFLVPHQLGYARVDAARGTREDAIALAVWACRDADDLDPAAPTVDLQAGGPTVTAGDTGSGIEPALPLLHDLLADGVTGTGPEVATAFAQARRALDARNLRWPVDLLDDLTDQLDAYRARSSRYEPTLAAAYVAETIARHRCVTGGGASLRVQVLGTEETAETPLRLLRLTGLGARVRGDDTSRTVEVYLAHPDAGVVLALRRRVEVADGEPPSAAVLGRRKAGGARLSALAAGHVVTESAVRSANRVVRFAESRLARTSLSPSPGDWDELPDGILVTDLDAEATRLAGFPPAVVRARVVAETVRAVAVESVEDVHYRPGSQQLRAPWTRSPARSRGTAALSASSPATSAATAAASTSNRPPSSPANPSWSRRSRAPAAAPSEGRPTTSAIHSPPPSTTPSASPPRWSTGATATSHPAGTNGPTAAPTSSAGPASRPPPRRSPPWPEPSGTTAATSPTGGPTPTCGCSSPPSNADPAVTAAGIRATAGPSRIAS